MLILIEEGSLISSINNLSSNDSDRIEDELKEIEEEQAAMNSNIGEKEHKNASWSEKMRG